MAIWHLQQLMVIFLSLQKNEYYGIMKDVDIEYSSGGDMSFELGAKWMRDKMLNNIKK